MKCKKCGKKLIVQQTLKMASDSICRRRFCPTCRIVYFTKEQIYEQRKLENN